VIETKKEGITQQSREPALQIAEVKIRPSEFSKKLDCSASLERQNVDDNFDAVSLIRCCMRNRKSEMELFNNLYQQNLPKFQDRRPTVE
jgi:hypothetical protein